MSTTNDNSPPAGQHPPREEWMEYLYDEASEENRDKLSKHLKTCAECRDKMEGWSLVGRSLDSWRPPQPGRAGFWPQPWFKWGLAAMLAAGFAFWAGRFSAPGLDMPSIRAEVQKEVIQQVSLIQNRQTQRMSEAVAAASKTEIQKVLSDRLKTLETSRQEDNRALIAAIENLATRQAVDYASLRGDLETLAVTAQGEILSTKKNFANLAAYATLANSQSNLKEH